MIVTFLELCWKFTNTVNQLYFMQFINWVSFLWLLLPYIASIYMKAMNFLQPSIAILKKVEKDRAPYSFHFLKVKWPPYFPLELSGHWCLCSKSGPLVCLCHHLSPSECCHCPSLAPHQWLLENQPVRQKVSSMRELLMFFYNTNFIRFFFPPHSF